MLIFFKKGFKNVSVRLIFLVIFVMAIFGYVERSSLFAKAFNNQVNIFPAQFSFDQTENDSSWSNIQNSFIQDLYPDSDLMDFNQDNSAYIIFGTALDKFEAVPFDLENNVEEVEPTEPDITEIMNSSSGSGSGVQSGISDIIIDESGDIPLSNEINQEQNLDLIPSSENIEGAVVEIINDQIQADVVEIIPDVITDQNDQVQDELPAREEVIPVNPEVLTEDVAPDESATIPVETPVLAPEQLAPELFPVEAPAPEPAGDVSVINRLISNIRSLVSLWKNLNIFQMHLARAENATSISVDDVSDISTQSIIFDDFGVPLEYQENKIGNVQLRLSLAARSSISEDKLVIEYTFNDAWEELGVLNIDSETSNQINGGYFLYGLPLFDNWNELNNLKVRLVHKIDNSLGESDVRAEIYLDALWLEIDYIDSGIEDEELLREEDEEEKKDVIIIDKEYNEKKYEKVENDKFNLELLSDDTDFKMDEKAKFKFRFQKKRGLLGGLGARLANLFTDEYADIKIIAKVLNQYGEVETLIDPKIEYLENGEFNINLEDRLDDYKPGKYTIVINIKYGQELFVSEQDFTWGVLALNTNRSIYLPTETAYLQMGVVDDEGHTICDAELFLEIVAPDGGVAYLDTKNGLLVQNPECGPDNVIDTPDYYAFYNLAGVGNYHMKLIASTTNGMKEVFDSFEVRNSVPFEVERIGPTRIYPKADYPMNIKIKANMDFYGDIIETVPSHFKIVEQKLTIGSSTIISGEPQFGLTDEPQFIIEQKIKQEKQVIWRNIHIERGSVLEINYTFDAPDVSPEFFLLGPLEFKDKRQSSEEGVEIEYKSIFQEARKWQIASDAVTDYQGQSVSGCNNQNYTSYQTTTFISSWGVCDRDRVRFDVNDTNEHDLLMSYLANGGYAKDMRITGQSSGNVINMESRDEDGTGYIRLLEINPSTGAEISTLDTYSFSMINGQAYVVTDISMLTGIVQSGNTFGIKISIASANNNINELRTEFGDYGVGDRQFLINVDESLANVPPNTPNSLKQYKSDRSSQIANQGWSDGNVLLEGAATDPDPTSVVTMYYEVVASSTSFTTSTSTPTSACSSGVDWTSCTGNIWKSIPWYNSGWQYRKQINIDAHDILSTETDFPLLINITDSDLATYARSDGFDIVFTDSGGTTTLDYEREYYASSTGDLVVWVKTNISSTTNTILYMYYASSTSADQSTGNTWDANFQGVWHLSEDPAVAGADGILDSTANNNDGTDNGTMNAVDQVTGQIDGSLDFDGIDDYINILDDNTLDIANTGTIEAWVNPDNSASSESNFNNWTTITAPDGQGAGEYADSVTFTIVGNKRYYTALLCSDTVETFSYANSNLDGTGFSGWATTTPPDGCGPGEGSSLAISSDGDLLYYAALLTNGGTESFYTATSTLTGSAFGSWVNRPDPTPSGGGDDCGVDMVLVDDKMYLAAFMHNNADMALLTAYVNLSDTDNSTFTGWTIQTDPPGTAEGGEGTSVAIDSDGEKLYYAALVYEQNGIENATEYFSTAYSDLDGSSFSSWTVQVAPNGAGAADPSYIDMAIVGDRLYYAAFLHSGATETFLTASSTSDGAIFSSWTSQSNPGGAGGGETTSPTILTDGKSIYYSAYSANNTVETFKITNSTITSLPILLKIDAYELIQTGTGFVFDWAGTPRSFGSVSTDNFSHVVITNDGSVMRYYLNGSLARSQNTSANFTVNTNVFRIGGDVNYYNGIVDEVRISNTARSAGWVQSSYLNQVSPASFVGLGQAETATSTSFNTLALTIPESATGYKWQVLACDDYETGECSDWVKFNTTLPNFKVDTTSPVAPGNLTEYSKSDTSITLSFGSVGSDTNFNRYKIFYKEATFGVTELDTEHTDTNLNYSNYNGASVTTINNLSSNSNYAFNIWIYDLAGNKTKAEEINIKTDAGFNPPTGTFNSVAQKTDGSGTVDISIEIDDPDDDDVRVKIEYEAGSTCAFSSTSIPTLDEADVNITADYGDPDIDNNSDYQIGTSSNWIITTSGSNSVNFDWNAKTDLPSANGVYCLRLIANDNNEDQAVSATTTVILDNTRPTAPGSLSVDSQGIFAVTLSLPTAVTETNFSEYKIFYKQGTSRVTESDSSHTQTDDSNFAYINFNSATTTTIGGLLSETQYVFNIYAYDQYGNKSSSTQELSLVTNKVVTIDKKFYIIPSSGIDVGADTTSVGCDGNDFSKTQTTLLSNTTTCGQENRMRFTPSAGDHFLHFAVLNTAYTRDTFISGTTTVSAITVREKPGISVNWYFEFCEYDPNGSARNCNSLGTSTSVTDNGGDNDVTLYPSTENMTGGTVRSGYKLAVKVMLNVVSAIDDVRFYLDNTNTPADLYINIQESESYVAPETPSALNQYKSDSATTISNGAVHNENEVNLQSSVIDADSNETLTLYYEFLDNAVDFTASNTEPVSSCVSGIAFGSCTSKIWKVTSSQGNYSSTPYTGSVNIITISDSTIGYKWQVLACDSQNICSNWQNFGVTIPNFTIDTSPDDPTTLGQYKTDGTTAIVNDTWTDENEVKLQASVIDPDASDTINLYFEIVANDGSFSNATTSACVSDATWAGCSSKVWYVTSTAGDYRVAPYTGVVNPKSIPDSGVGYKWQVMACDSDSTCSDWIQFAGGPNFKIDATDPVAPGALSFNTVGATSIIFDLGAAGSDTNFSVYKIFYKIGSSGVTDSDSEFIDDNFYYVDYNSATTTIINSLSAGSQYVFNIWIYDTANNKASSTIEISTTTLTSFTPPTGSFNSVSQKTDGSGRVDISIVVDDPDNDDTLRVKMEYEAGDTCAFSPSVDPTIDEIDANITAVYGDPNVDDSYTYQVGTSSSWIITSPGANYVFFDWMTKTDIPTANGTYCLRMTVNDGLYDQATSTTQLLIIDNVSPSIPGALTFNAKTDTTLTLNLGAQSSDTRFRDYRVYYSTSSPVTASDIESDDVNFDYDNYNGATTTTITGLVENTTYYINIWAFDDQGNGASSSAQLSVKTNALPINVLASEQYKSDATTVISNGSWATESEVKLKASANDPDTSEIITLYFELLTDAGVFTTATTAPSGACSYGSAYGSCSSKIWFVASSSPADYSVTPFTDTVSITSIPDSATGYKWQVLACDDTNNCSNSWTVFNAVQPNFKIDTADPVAPGILVENSKGTRQITLAYGTAGSDANFTEYKIFYGTTTPVTESSTEHIDSNLAYVNYNGATDTTFYDLEPNTTYYFNIWIYDDSLKKASSTEISVTTNTAGTPTSVRYWIIPDSGTNVGADTTNLACDGNNYSPVVIGLLSSSDSTCEQRARIEYTPGIDGTYLMYYGILDTAYSVDTYIEGNTTNSAITVSERGDAMSWYFEFCEYDPNGSTQNCNPLGTSTTVTENAADNDTVLNPSTNNRLAGTIRKDYKLGVKLYLIDASNPKDRARVYLDENNTPADVYIWITETPDVAPFNPTSLTQYKSDSVTTISNNTWTEENQVVLEASAMDPETTDTLTLYFELATSTGVFTTTVTEPASSCSSGTAYGSCSPKIWSITSVSGDYSVTPFVGSSSVTSVPDDNYKWQVITCDSGGNCSSWVPFNATTPNFKVDNTNPTTPGNLTINSLNSTSVTLNFGSQTTETNFANYKIYYKQAASGVVETDTEHIDTDLNYINYNSTSNTMITGLSPVTQYVFNIWAYDEAGNKASATEVATTTTTGMDITQTSYLIENDDGSDINSNTADFAVDATSTNMNIGERMNIRIQIDNTGGDTATSKVYRLQFENNTDNPGAWSDVGVNSAISYGLGLSGSSNSNITSAKSTANGGSWVNGKWFENTNETSAFTLDINEYSEFVFALKTDYATVGKTYRLRLYNITDGSVLNAYDFYPAITTIATETKRYSKDAVIGLSGSNNSLTYYLDPEGYVDLSADDAARDVNSAFSKIPVYNFATKHANDTDAISITWNGQSSVSPLFNNVILQVYRFGTTNAWVTLDTDSAASADTDFGLTATLNYKLSEYYDGNNWTYWRVYQQSGTMDLSSDYFNASFAAPVDDTTQEHYRWRDDDGNESGATWREAEDTGDPTLGTNLAKNTNVRLRFSVSNTGGGNAVNYDYQLEYATTATNCSTDPGGWVTVPDVPTTEHFDMVTSGNFTNGAPTTAQFTNSESYTFVAGSMVESTSNSSGNITLSEDEYSEVEYVFQANASSTDGGTYCFRVTDTGAALDNYDNYAEITIAGVTNNAPSFTVNPIDNGSASTSPTSYGNNVTFDVTASDVEGDDYYLAVCQTDSVIPGNDSAPTCGGGTWCVSTISSSTVEASCNYTTATSTESNTWYAFVCDHHPGSGVAKCSASSQGGYGNNDDSPFNVNNPPTFTSVSTLVDNQDPGSSFTITTVSSESDISGGADTMSLYVCSTDNADYTGCIDTTICSEIATTSPNSQCSFSTAVPAASGATTYYAFMFDSHSLAATANSRNNTYTINNIAPTMGSLILNGGSAITLNIKGAGDTQVQTVNVSVTDNNGCGDLQSATSTVYMSNATSSAACTADDSYCYQVNAGSCIKTACAGGSDTIATYTCTANMKYFAVPTDNSTNNPWSLYDWVSKMTVFDGLTYISTTSTAVELNTVFALEVEEAAIDFGAGWSEGQNSGTSNEATTITNSGNSPINTNLSGTDMTGNPSGIISVANLEWSLTNGFNWSTGTDLDSFGTDVNIITPRPSGTTISDMVYWGIGIPFGSDASIFTGLNTFTVILDSNDW